jgi:hypothetical protein
MPRRAGRSIVVWCAPCIKPPRKACTGVAGIPVRTAWASCSPGLSAGSAHYSSGSKSHEQVATKQLGGQSSETTQCPTDDLPRCHAACFLWRADSYTTRFVRSCASRKAASIHLWNRGGLCGHCSYWRSDYLPVSQDGLLQIWSNMSQVQAASLFASSFALWWPWSERDGYLSLLQL